MSRNGTGCTLATDDGGALHSAVDAAFAQLATTSEAVGARRKRPGLKSSANGSVASLWLASFAALHPCE